MWRRCIAFGILFGSCGQGDPASENTASTGRSPEGRPETGVAAPPRAEGVFRLLVTAKQAEGAPPPDGYRLLRLPPRLEDFPPGAQVDRREVQKGAWRPYLGPDQAVVIDLEPTDEVAADRWMVVAYAQNDVHQFRFAEANLKMVELGSSEVFQLDPEGGELPLTVEVREPLQLVPSFEEPVAGPIAFDFQYRPIAASPRTVRGDWNGPGPLPLRLSRYAIGRESQMSLTIDGWPHARTVGPIEVQLQDGINLFDFGFPPRMSPWHLDIGTEENRASWTNAEVLAGFYDAEGQRQVASAGRSNTQGTLTLPRAFSGRYHLSARAENGDILLGWDSHGGEEDRTAIATPPLQETGVMDCVDLPEGEWQAEVWSFWGPILVGRSTGVPGQPLQLPHAGEMRHQALVRREIVGESAVTEAWIFLECEWHDGKWVFHGAPTRFKVDSFTDEIELELRLSLTDRPEPEQFFPPPQWQVEPGRIESVDHFPVRYRGGLILHGLPEGQYEAGIYGREVGSNRIAELATFYPVANRILSEEE